MIVSTLWKHFLRNLDMITIFISLSPHSPHSNTFSVLPIPSLPSLLHDLFSHCHTDTHMHTHTLPSPFSGGCIYMCLGLTTRSWTIPHRAYFWKRLTLPLSAIIIAWSPLFECGTLGKNKVIIYFSINKIQSYLKFLINADEATNSHFSKSSVW